MAIETAENMQSRLVAEDVRDAAFSKAQRHSRRVSWLKTALPATAAVIGIGFVVYSYLVTPAVVDVNISESAISDGRLVMASPKLEGFTKDNRAYSMTAARAFQDLKDTGLIELEDISAKLPFDADNIATMSSPKGFYNREANTLELNGDLSIKTTDGMSAKMKSAFIDIAKGNVTTTQPVDIVLNGVTVSADSMTVEDRGKILVFDKRVRMVLEPKRATPKTKANGS